MRLYQVSVECLTGRHAGNYQGRGEVVFQLVGPEIQQKYSMYLRFTEIVFLQKKNSNVVSSFDFLVNDLLLNVCSHCVIYDYDILF